MSRVAYVDGRYVRHASAAVSIEDRGFQFADAIYEVWAVFDGRLAEAEGHMARLQRSLGELHIPMPMTSVALTLALKETLRRNRVSDGMVYLQISRGTARRDHAFPMPAVKPTVVITARGIDFAVADRKMAEGVSVVTAPDQRWGRCDIKTVGLLPNVLAKQAARESGAFEAWLVDADGLVTEGASTNAWIVDQEGRLRTRDTGANILRGVTRLSLMALAEQLQMPVVEKPFTVAEAKAAREAFVTAASAFVTPVVRIDGDPVGDGRVGPVSARLRRLYQEEARRTAS